MNAALTDTAELTDTAALINEETQGSTRSDVEQLGSEICALAGQIAAATARFLTLLSKFDEDRGWSGPGLHSCAHWLSWKCGMSLHTGREYVRVAKALRPLPEMRKAFEQGRLSYSKVRALTRVTTPSNEQQMVRFGCEAPAAQIDRLAAGLRKATDNESGKSKAPEHLQVRWHWDSDTGEFVIKGRLPAQDGARILAALAVAERERTRTAAIRPVDEKATKNPAGISDQDSSRWQSSPPPQSQTARPRPPRTKLCSSTKRTPSAYRVDPRSPKVPPRKCSATRNFAWERQRRDAF